MIELSVKNNCSGCAACRAVCPKSAIAMVADAEGFLYPRIDKSRCVSCGKCRAACPSLNRPPPREPRAVYAAVATDDALRMASSSGGMFSLLARQVLARGGVVFGAAWDYTDYSVKIVAAHNEEELGELRGSKYVQADVGDAYFQAREALKKGIPVLYSGTPCQIAALKRFLGGETEGLLAVDLICHGVPSPLAFRKYAAARERAANSMISLKTLTEDPFLRGFLSELYNRPSCHHCAVRELRSGADLTIADYWGVEQRFPQLDDDKGTSVVLVNTERGAAAFAAIKDLCRVAESDYDDIRRTNTAVCRSPLPHPRRARFFAKVGRTDDFDALVTRLLRPTLYQRIRHLGGCVLRKLHLRKSA